MKGIPFNFKEREKLAEMWLAYESAAKIAAELNVAEPTIHRELIRGEVVGETDKNQRRKYDPVLAQRVLHESLRRRGRKGKRHDNV